MENYQAALDTAFHALADPTRRAVIARLIEGSASVKELAEPFDMGLPSFLKHVKVLEASGLIGSEKIGRVRICRLVPARLIAAEDWLSEQRAVWQGRTDRLAAFVERQHLIGDEQ
ncbi:MAG: metalloregulator ArsR/SmtB family transcription factor [Rhodospirillum sp.]|nr:metalloregulator ArsR/SmtB family transcription factor [Rhodospirillum sp.]MCF8488224.1 metalloregulator ArsR/SmtB family transcription factor [Rhodospirillum sp.]MCF8502521.1 metalloregulator ArsR/SmtB family transcription factor [Rhodospirillum sp.]